MKKINLKYDPRDQQTEILEFVKESISSGKKFVTIDAPTGVGKSFAAVMVSDWYVNEINEDAKIDIITNTKLLQDQYKKDFDFMACLKGSNSYWCRNNFMNCGEAKILNKARDRKCRACPYTIDQRSFLDERISLTNYHLITAYSMYNPDMLAERGSNLLIVDEAHAFEEAFCDFVASVFSERSLTAHGIWEEWMKSDLDSISDIHALSDYVKSVIIPRMSKKMTEYTDLALDSRSRKKKAEYIKKADHCDKTMCKYNRFVNDKENYRSNWIFEKEDGLESKILVEPVWANVYMKEMFWDKYDHVIFMSGTIIDPDIFNFLMGIDQSENAYLSLPCPFKKENRKIVYVKFGKMSYREKEKTFKRAVPIIKRILEKNSEHKGIIHSGNYQFNEWIRREIKDRRLIVHDSSTREESLKLHIESEYNTVIVSPSMMNGIDLKDDLSRFQIILKVPFPNLKSSKIKKRLEMKPDWYNWRALIDIMQSYGRSIRNEEDWAETYVLDECFEQIINKSVPKYFTEAISMKRLPSA